MKILIEMNHSVTFVTSNFDHGKKTHIPSDQLLSTIGLKVFRVPGYHKNVGFKRLLCHWVFASKLWLWAFWTKWDTVVISSIPPEVLMSSIFLRKKNLLIDVRDIWPDALLSYNNKSLLYKIFSRYCQLIYKFTLKQAKSIMVVAPGFNSWVKSYVKKHSIKVKFVPLGFRREDFSPLSINKSDADYKFCYAGGATPQFDISEFSPSLGSKRGLVLGDGPLLDDWKDLFVKTHFTGSIPRDDALNMMRKSEVLLFPSNPFAQLPNKAFDYFSLGLPVLLGDDCSRATCYLLELRKRRQKINSCPDTWFDYKVLEKENITKRIINIIEEV